MILEDAYVSFLIEHKLTQGQFLSLMLVYKGRRDLMTRYREAFPSGDSTMIGAYMTEDLFIKGFLSREDNGKIKVTKKFLEAFINKHTASDEIFNLYPTHFTKDGISFPLSAMDRNVFANLYDIAIMSSIGEHLEVVKDIIFAIQKDLLKIGIDKFVKSKYWLVIRPIRLADVLKESVPSALDNEF